MSGRSQAGRPARKDHKLLDQLSLPARLGVAGSLGADLSNPDLLCDAAGLPADGLAEDRYQRGHGSPKIRIHQLVPRYQGNFLVAE
jgi:hypothetical protein